MSLRPDLAIIADHVPPIGGTLPERLAASSTTSRQPPPREIYFNSPSVLLQNCEAAEALTFWQWACDDSCFSRDEP